MFHVEPALDAAGAVRESAPSPPVHDLLRPLRGFARRSRSRSDRGRFADRPTPDRDCRARGPAARAVQQRIVRPRGRHHRGLHRRPRDLGAGARTTDRSRRTAPGSGRLWCALPPLSHRPRGIDRVRRPGMAAAVACRRGRRFFSSDHGLHADIPQAAPGQRSAARNRVLSGVGPDRDDLHHRSDARCTVRRFRLRVPGRPVRCRLQCCRDVHVPALARAGTMEGRAAYEFEPVRTAVRAGLSAVAGDNPVLLGCIRPGRDRGHRIRSRRREVPHWQASCWD